MMALDQAALFKQASELESKVVEENKFHPAFMLELDALLLEVYASLLPTKSEYEQRRQLVQTYNMTAKSIFGNSGGFPVVEAFGSFMMDIFTAKSDLDLSINFNNGNAMRFRRNQIISVLRRFAKVLYKREREGYLSGVLPILTARVPVLKAVDCKTGVECDISVENKDGISRSLFFSIISSIDERFRILSYLMKAWAKAQNINSSKDGTMNSLSIISLVSFHLQALVELDDKEQTRYPPIMPPFSTFLRDGMDAANIRNLVLKLKGFGVSNKESVGELFVSLLAKLSSVEKLWELGLCISTFEGSWISKIWCSKVGNMSVEDFLDRNQNFARCVGKSEMPKIYDCIRRSLKYLADSMLGQIETSELGCLLFGPASLGTPCNDSNSEFCSKPALPLPNIITTQSSLSKKNRRRRKRELPVETAIPSSHSDSNADPSHVQNTPESVLPPVVSGHHNAEKCLVQKPTCSASVRPNVETQTHKRPRHDQIAGASSHHENQSNINMPAVYPIRYHLPPRPIMNGVVHPQFPYVYVCHQNHLPPQPNMMLAPQYQTRAVRLPYGSPGVQYAPNVANPIVFPGTHQFIVPGYPMNNVRQTQQHQPLLVPPRPPWPSHG